MKKLIIPFLLVMALVFQSCEQTESPIYDGNQTLAYFNGSGATLEVEINSTGEITIPVNVSTLSTSDRTVNISVNAGATTATAGQYSFNSAVTIPANTYFSSFTLTGIDDGLTTDGVTLTLQIDGVNDGGVGSSRGYAVTIVEICPIDPTFAVGAYTLNTTSGGIPAAGFAPAMGNGVTVNLVAGSSSTERRYNVKFYPTFGFANPAVNVAFTLVCEETVFGGIVSPGVSGVGCGSSIPFGRSSTNGTYNTADDSVITLFYLEDVGGASCGTEAEGSVSLTKQ